jgi:hypothetical protein
MARCWCCRCWCCWCCWCCPAPLHLEPVAHGHPVAGLVMEELVGNSALHVLVVVISGGRRAGEDVGGIKSVEPHVLHAARLKVGYRHNLEEVEIALHTKRLLVPPHGSLQACQRPVCTVSLNFFLCCPHPQLYGATRTSDVAALKAGQLARHHAEEVGGLGDGVHPRGKVPAVGQVAALSALAVAEQHGAGSLICLQPHSVPGCHIWPVNEVGDAPEALGLVVGDQQPACHEQALQVCVGARAQ